MAVEVNAFLSERAAKALAKKLEDKDYDAYFDPTTIKVALGTGLGWAVLPCSRRQSSSRRR